MKKDSCLLYLIQESAEYIPLFDCEGYYVLLPDKPGSMNNLVLPLYLYWSMVRPDLTN
jgi:hypothetical protein